VNQHLASPMKCSLKLQLLSMLCFSAVIATVSVVLYGLGDTCLALARAIDVPARVATVELLRVENLSPLAMFFCTLWILFKFAAALTIPAGLVAMAEWAFEGEK